MWADRAVIQAGATAAKAPRILVVRLSAIGDVVMASGLIPALRARWPDAHLAWLTDAPTVPLLRHNPRLDEVLVWPRREWQQLWGARRYVELLRQVNFFRKSLRQRRFDIVLDVQGLLKSGLCAWWTGAPRRIGLISREGSHHLMHERVLPPPEERPQIGSEYRALARYLDAPQGSFQLDLAVGDEPRAAAQRVLAAAGVRQRYAVLCPFTTRPQKHWFDDYWGELAERLAARGLTPVMLGGPTDADVAARIAARSSSLINLVGKCKLDESVAVVEGCGLLVGVDTGLTHMGTALRRPTVALFGSTRPYLDTGSPGSVVMYDALPCSPCRRHPTCGGAFTCMRGLTVDRVLVQAGIVSGLVL